MSNSGQKVNSLIESDLSGHLQARCIASQNLQQNAYQEREWGRENWSGWLVLYVFCCINPDLAHVLASYLNVKYKFLLVYPRLCIAFVSLVAKKWPFSYPSPERSEGVGYKKWRKRNCVYYAEASEKGGEFLWSVCMSVCELSPPSCLDLAGSSFQGMLGSYVVVHCFDLSWICWETKIFC